MALIPQIRILFDRKKRATATKTGSVDIEINYDGSRKWISSGVKVLPQQWKKGKVVNHPEARVLNSEIQKMYNAIHTRLQIMVKEGVVDLDELTRERTAQLKSEGSFLDYMEKKIETRSDLRESTRKHHRTLHTLFSQWGKIVTFRDITLPNIKEWDEYLVKTRNSQATGHNYHKRLRPYIQMAFEEEFIAANPYDKMHISKGETESIKYLTEEERDRIANLPLHGYIEKARDMFIFSCYTGLGYADLIKVSHDDIFAFGDKEVIIDSRQKTGNEYKIALLPPAKRILEKYSYNMKLLTNQKCNEYLSVIAEMAEIDKHITMHVGRHTFATWALTKGTSIEVVSKMLAHSDIHTTQVYAKVLDSRVMDGFDNLSKFAN